MAETAEHLGISQYRAEAVARRIGERIDGKRLPPKLPETHITGADMDEFLSQYNPVDGHCISTEHLLRRYICFLECPVAQMYWTLPRFERALEQRGYLIGRLTALRQCPLNWTRGIINVGGPGSQCPSARRLEIGEAGYAVPVDPTDLERQYLTIRGDGDYAPRVPHIH